MMFTHILCKSLLNCLFVCLAAVSHLNRLNRGYQKTILANFKHNDFALVYSHVLIDLAYLFSGIPH